MATVLAYKGGNLQDMARTDSCIGTYNPMLSFLLRAYHVVVLRTFYSAPRFQLIEQFTPDRCSYAMKLEVHICRQSLLVGGKEGQRMFLPL